MRPERRLRRNGSNAISVLFRLLRKYNLSLFLTLMLMSCTFTFILVLTSTDPRLAGYEFLPHDDSLQQSSAVDVVRGSENVHDVVKVSENVQDVVGNIHNIVKMTKNGQDVIEKVRKVSESVQDVENVRGIVKISENVQDIVEKVRNNISKVPEDVQDVVENVRHTVRVSENVRNTSDDDARSIYESTRVLCVIVTRRKYPSEKSHHVNATWGRRCNKLVFMEPTQSPKWTSPNMSTGKDGPVLSKPQNTFQYVYDHHLADADWFMKADDDTYVIVENLRYLVAAYDSVTPIFFGHRYKSGYVSAGAGYVLSRRAVELLVESGFSTTGVCPDSGRAEDIEVAACLERLGIIPGDSRDSQGRDRFFPVLPEDVFFPDSENNLAWYWNASYYEKKTGLECCSDKAITFRVVEPEQMYLLEYFIYHVKPHGGGYPEGRAFAYPFV